MGSPIAQRARHAVASVRRRVRRAVARHALTVAGRAADGAVIALDHPPSGAPGPRWGRGRPVHRRLAERLDRDRNRYAENLRTIFQSAGDLSRIPVAERDPLEPFWANPTMSGLDGAGIYGFLRAREPRRYVEVGSGNSTKFAARARADGGFPCEIVSIDPGPVGQIDPLCDRRERVALERAVPGLFALIEPGDVVFFDGSHRVFTNSDVTVFFLEILPALPAGVLVGVHDIFLPEDYPPEWTSWWLSEQYLLAAMLLTGDALTVELPCHYVCTDPELGADLRELWGSVGLGDANAYGSTCWLSTT